MTVGKLLEILEKYDKDTPVVIRDTSPNALDEDFCDLQVSNVVKIEGKPIFRNIIAVGRQLYDGTVTPYDDESVELISLTGKPRIQR